MIGWLNPKANKKFEGDPTVFAFSLDWLLKKDGEEQQILRFGLFFMRLLGFMDSKVSQTMYEKSQIFLLAVDQVIYLWYSVLPTNQIDMVKN